MKITWNNFLKIAVQNYPKESCGFLFSRLPYSSEEELVVFPVKNISITPTQEWIPEPNEMAKVKAKARRLGLVKIGNVHTHPFGGILAEHNTDLEQLMQPSDKDLKFAQKFNDILRIIIVVIKLPMDEFLTKCYAHDKFGNKIDLILEEK